MSSSLALHILLVNLCLLFIGAIVTSLLSGTWRRFSIQFGHTIGIAGSALFIVGGAVALSGQHQFIKLLHGVFSFTSVEYQINHLSSWFIILLGIAGLFACVFAIGYLNTYEKHSSIPQLLAGTQLFLAAMASVILAANVFTFLVSWEFMSIISFLLVMFEDEHRENHKAGFIYVSMTHVGTGCLTIAFFLLSHYSGTYEFASMQAVQMPAMAQSLTFLLMFIGFATKAGLVPLHIWLPRAHPVAPSHISALMSGFMIKTAVYGFVLFTFQFLHAAPIWWGILVAMIGALTAIIGAIYSLSDTDQKRMLAYSSVENMGLIFLGLGTSLIFFSEHHMALSSIALLASFVHLTNHTIFKSLLFLGSGAVFTITGTKNMDLLGGLIRKMPWTALFVLIGSMSISALPPLNGFVGEWMLFQSLFSLSYSGGTVEMHIFGALLIAVLTFTAALAAMAFVRSFSMTFLALPRSDLSRPVHEVGPTMKISMAGLAILCFLLGILPGWWIHELAQSVPVLIGHTVPFVPTWGGFVLPTQLQTRLSVNFIGITLIFGIAIAMLLSRFAGGHTKVVPAETWACGNTLTPRMTYTASGYSKPIRMLFRFLLQSTRHLERANQNASPYFSMRHVYVSKVHAVAERYMYRPLVCAILKTANAIRTIQNGQVQGYLAYIFLALIAVLILSR